MRKKGKLKGTGQVRASLFMLGGVALTMLLSGVKLPYALTPGGLAFAGAWELAGLPGGLVLLSIALYRAGGRTAAVIFYRTLSLAPLFLSFYLKSRKRLTLKVLVILLLATGSGLVFIYWQGGQGLAVPLAAEIVAVGILAWLLAPRLEQLAAIWGIKGSKKQREAAKGWWSWAVAPAADCGTRLLWTEGSSRLSRLGDFFQELGQTFQPVPDEKTNSRHEEILALLQAIADQNCLSCVKYDLCWQERFYQTYRELFVLMGWAEGGVTVGKSHLKGYLAQECLKPEALLTTVNLTMKQERTGQYWHRRYTEAKWFLADRLTGVAAVLMQMAETSVASQDEVVERAQKLSKVLRKAGVSRGEVKIVSGGGKQGDHRLLVEKKACSGRQECRLIVAPILAKALGRQLAVTDEACGRRRDGYCSFCLMSEPAYGICSAVVQLPKQGNRVSGDSQETRLIGDHLFLSLLSDGMGVGTTAARISQAAVKLIEGMLVAGFEKNFALENLNSILLLATPEEEFATLDLLLFNRLSGEVELFKVGSAPTYVKKEREVQVIRSTALPVGIVPQIDPEYYRDFLDDGDLIVLVSDGAATLGTKGGEDWILKALKRTETSAAQSLCEYLLELAKIESDGEINDDLTIMVLQVVTHPSYRPHT